MKPLLKNTINLSINSRKLLIFIIFIMSMINFATSQSAPCNSQCKSLAFYTCTICYQSCDNYSAADNTTSKTFNFQSCQQQYCSHTTTTIVYDSDNTSHTQQQCTQYDKRLLPQGQCINNCCGAGNSQYAFTYQTFNQCVSKNQQLRSTVIMVGIIIGSVFGGICLVAIIIVGIRCLFDQCSSCSCKCKCWRRSYTAESTYKQKQSQNHSELQMPQKKWHQFDKEVEINQ